MFALYSINRDGFTPWKTSSGDPSLGNSYGPERVGTALSGLVGLSPVTVMLDAGRIEESRISPARKSDGGDCGRPGSGKIGHSPRASATGVQHLVCWGNLHPRSPHDGTHARAYVQGEKPRDGPRGPGGPNGCCCTRGPTSPRPSARWMTSWCACRPTSARRAPGFGPCAAWVPVGVSFSLHNRELRRDELCPPG